MSKKAAPNTAGNESKNENTAESSLDMPVNSPAVIVVPDLDMPGMIAMACETPTIKDLESNCV